MRTIFLLLLWSSSALAEIPENRLALLVARTVANEASLSARPADVHQIWWIVQGHGATTTERTDWLQRHSSCVATDRPLSRRQRRTNCPWARTLRFDLERGEGWPEAIAWSNVYRSRWERILKLSLKLVWGRARLRPPCAQRPSTWGGRVIDMAQALRRGLVPVNCVGTANEGFVTARALAPRSRILGVRSLQPWARAVD